MEFSAFLKQGGNDECKMGIAIRVSACYRTSIGNKKTHVVKGKEVLHVKCIIHIIGKNYSQGDSS